MANTSGYHTTFGFCHEFREFSENHSGKTLVRPFYCVNNKWTLKDGKQKYLIGDKSRISQMRDSNLLFGEIFLKTAWKWRKLDRDGGVVNPKFVFIDTLLLISLRKGRLEWKVVQNLHLPLNIHQMFHQLQVRIQDLVGGRGQLPRPKLLEGERFEIFFFRFEHLNLNLPQGLKLLMNNFNITETSL